jgi:Tol biopolymer transport system component
MRTNTWIVWMMSAALALAVGATQKDAQKDPRAEAQVQAAINKETVEGDLNAAIEMYKKVAALPGASRAVVAQALVRMGQCYEKLGKKEAQQAYERVVREFADQSELAAQARARLTALGGPGGAGGFITRQILADASGVSGVLTADGKYIRGIDWETGDVVQFEVAGGQKSRIKNKGPWSETEASYENQAFSRDGKQIAYNSYTKDWVPQLRIRNLDGSGLRTLYSEKDSFVHPLDWSPDAGSVFALRGRNKAVELTLISTIDGSVRVLRSLASHLFMLESAGFSPDGRFIAFNLQREGTPPHGDMMLMTADGRNEVVVAGHPAEDQLIGWTPDGKSLVFVSDRSGTWDIWRVQITGGKQQGEPELLKKDFGYHTSDVLGLAPDGSLYYKTNTSSGRLFYGAFDLDTGKVIVPPAPVTTRYTSAPSQLTWSPDGESLAYISFRGGQPAMGNIILVIRSAATGRERFLSPPLRFLNQISWAPDSRSILAVGMTVTERGIYRIDIETSGITKLAAKGMAPKLCPDGKTLVFVKTGPIIVKQNLNTGEQSDVVKIYGLNYDLSPDGKDVMFQVDDIFKIVSLNGGEPREVFRGSAGKARWARWTKDGRTILVKEDQTFWRLPAQGGTPLKLDLAVQKMHSFTLHPDMRRFAFGVNEGSQNELWVMENFLPAPKVAK